MRLLMAIALVLLALPAAAAMPDIDAINAAVPGARPAKGARGPDPVVIKAQVLLDRAGFSPGEINGRLDENTGKALAAFAASHQLAAKGAIDPGLWTALTAQSGAPVLTRYVIAPQDVRGPFLKKRPAKLEAMKDLERLSYTGPRQELAEKFHMSEQLLAALNPEQSFDKAGTSIVVADVAGQQTGKVGRIEIDKKEHLLRAFGPNDELVAVFPASIGSREKPAPSGTFKVTSITHNPTYRYDPAYAFKGVKAKRPFTIKPGPNNPVGTVWIALSAKGGYGIHGTPDPANVGKTASHGCIRLTNWDAERLAAMTGKGVPVAFLDAPSGAAALVQDADRGTSDKARAHR
jgi:lipoprotein-anchoring transpeptidase ErfK/SrfK